MTATLTAAELLAQRMRRTDGTVGLVPYLMAGHPDAATTRDTGRRLAAADGVAAVELGLPHSDPLADGPVIARAGRRALDAGATTASSLDTAAAIAGEGGAPVVLMTYLNPVLAYGVDRFAADAAGAGVSGVILPDVPVDEVDPLLAPLHAHGMATALLVAPTSPDARVDATCAASSGFVYCVTVTGITGSRTELPESLPDLLGRVRDRTGLPIAAGFGISRPEQVRALRGHADAVVVGSAIVAEIDQGHDPAPLVKELLTACTR